MKRILFFSIAICLLMQAKQGCGQSPIVYDPTNYALAATSWGEQLESAAQQVETLSKSKDLLQKSIDLFSEVNSYISQAATVYDIIDRQVTLVGYISDQLSRTDDIADMETFASYSRRLISYTTRLTRNVEKLSGIISKSLRMNDAERMEQIDKIDGEIRTIAVEIYATTGKFDELNRNMLYLNRLKEKFED